MKNRLILFAVTVAFWACLTVAFGALWWVGACWEAKR